MWSVTQWNVDYYTVTEIQCDISNIVHKNQTKNFEKYESMFYKLPEI